MEAPRNMSLQRDTDVEQTEVPYEGTDKEELRRSTRKRTPTERIPLMSTLMKQGYDSVFVSY